jgi:Caspase domain
MTWSPVSRGAITSMTMRCMVVLAAILLPVSVKAKNVQLVAAGGGQVRALVVGINEYSSRSIPTLKGAVADARDLETTLRAAGVRDLTALIDATATRQSFETAMDRLVDASRPGDLVIVSFAGHGSQAPELVGGSEADGMDEIFLLSGFDTAGLGTKERVIDDEINHWLLQLAKKNVDVLYIADTCHGGGMLRSPDFRSGDVSYRFVAISMDPQDDKLSPISTVADAKASPDDLPNVTFLGAVNKLSKAPEVNIPGNATLRGALSYAVARSIDGGRDGAVTRQQLFGFARQITYQYSQTKQTIATEPTGNGAALDKVVFRLKVSGEPEDPSANDEVRLRISGSDAGALSGVGPDQSQFRIVKNGEDADIVWDVANGEVLNAYGDVLAGSVTASDIPAIAESVKAALAIAKLSEDGPQSMRLLPNDGRFHQGDEVTFHVEGIAGKCLILVHLSGSGRVRLLFPRLKVDVALMWDADFDLPLQVVEPFGLDQVVAIVSDRRLVQAEAAIRALDDQKAAATFVGILRSVQLSDPNVRFGMAASFTAQ